ncbi:repeat element 14 [Diadegma semiclausum ichnovirus]|nr:repeat element 14 [Diadegma semiclausum ichnovirus]
MKIGTVFSVQNWVLLGDFLVDEFSEFSVQYDSMEVMLDTVDLNYRIHRHIYFIHSAHIPMFPIIPLVTPSRSPQLRMQPIDDSVCMRCLQLGPNSNDGSADDGTGPPPPPQTINAHLHSRYKQTSTAFANNYIVCIAMLRTNMLVPTTVCEDPEPLSFRQDQRPPYTSPEEDIPKKKFKNREVYSRPRSIVPNGSLPNNSCYYQSLIRAFWPDGDEDELIKKKLWEMSCHNLEATFYNGKHLEIEYNFDAKRKKQHRVLIRVECLLPIFGGVQPLGLDEFVNIIELKKCIQDNVSLESCSSYRCVCCPYHLGLDLEEFTILFIEPTLIECEKSHFHHYCKKHVISWLFNYLHPLILLWECKELFDEQIAEQYAFFPSCIPFFQTGSRATPQFLLESALNISTHRFVD